MKYRLLTETDLYEVKKFLPTGMVIVTETHHRLGPVSVHLKDKAAKDFERGLALAGFEEKQVNQLCSAVHKPRPSSIRL